MNVGFSPYLLEFGSKTEPVPQTVKPCSVTKRLEIPGRIELLSKLLKIPRTRDGSPGIELVMHAVPGIICHFA
jgi:hypothetical protein